MYERERIKQLHRQGYCTAYISTRIKVPSDFVRRVVEQDNAIEALRALRPDAVLRARRDKAEQKRALALRLLDEAESEGL